MFKFINDNTTPEYNLALEEILCAAGQEFFMLWRNRPSVIISRFGQAEAEVNLNYARSKRINLVRRNSGGGAVYHDLGNINFSFILHDKKIFTLEYFSGIVIKILDEIGINARLEFSHNDIKADGKKISGQAQYHHEGIILHHGTILFDTDLNIIPKVLKRSGSVTNVKPLLKHELNISEFMSLLYDKIDAEKIFIIPKELQSQAQNLMHLKYFNLQWNMEGII